MLHAVKMKVKIEPRVHDTGDIDTWDRHQGMLKTSGAVPRETPDVLQRTELERQGSLSLLRYSQCPK